MSEKLIPAPATEGVLAAFSIVPDFNIAASIEHIRQPSEPVEVDYTQTTDNGLASRRSKHAVRSFDEVALAQVQQPTLPEGFSMRCAMPGQCENNQFPMRTNRFGKMRD